MTPFEAFDLLALWVGRLLIVGGVLFLAAGLLGAWHADWQARRGVVRRYRRGRW